MYLVISLIVTIIELLKCLYLDREYLDDFEVWIKYSAFNHKKFNYSFYK